MKKKRYRQNPSQVKKLKHMIIGGRVGDCNTGFQLNQCHVTVNY